MTLSSATARVGPRVQMGFASDILLIGKDDRCLRKQGGPDSDVNAVSRYFARSAIIPNGITVKTCGCEARRRAGRRVGARARTSCNGSARSRWFPY